MEFSALGERIMTTLNRCDPRCSAPLRASPRHWPLDAQLPRRSEGGRGGPGPLHLETLPWVPASTGEGALGAAWASLPFLLIGHFRLLICEVLLEVCQVGPEKEAKWGQRMKAGTTFICIHAKDTYHPTTIFLLLYPHEGCCLVPYCLALQRQLWWTASVMSCHEPCKSFLEETRGISRSFITFAQISLLWTSSDSPPEWQ